MSKVNKTSNELKLVLFCAIIGAVAGIVFWLFLLALMFFPGNAAHATFAAAVCAAWTLGVSMKKPLAVSLLLLLCFPVKTLIWILPAAALAALAGKLIENAVF